MRKEVMVTVVGTQKTDWGDEDTIEMITVGSYYTKNECYYIIYNESEISGMEGTTTSLKVESNRVVLNRMGMAELRQVFEEGVLNHANYVTPYGAMKLTVMPSKVEVDLTELGGSINLEYELTIGNDKISDNKLSITVEEDPLNAKFSSGSKGKDYGRHHGVC